MKRTRLFTAPLLFIVLSLMNACTSSRHFQSTQSLTPKIFDELYTQTRGIMIDVRSPEEYSTAQIPGAINIDLMDPAFVEEIRGLEKSKFYFIYCFSGIQSRSAQSLMIQQGFKKVFILSGGIMEWRKAELPLLSEVMLNNRHVQISQAGY